MGLSVTPVVGWQASPEKGGIKPVTGEQSGEQIFLFCLFAFINQWLRGILGIPPRQKPRAERFWAFLLLSLRAFFASPLALEGRPSGFTLVPLCCEGGEIKSPWWLCPLVRSEGDGHEGATTAQRPTMGKETP